MENDPKNQEEIPTPEEVAAFLNDMTLEEFRRTNMIDKGNACPDRGPCNRKTSSDELKNLLENAADDIETDYHYRFSYFLESLGLLSELEGKDSIPLEVWIGIAQAVADASGYRIALQAKIVAPAKNGATADEMVDHREVAIAEPTIFAKPAEDN